MRDGHPDDDQLADLAADVLPVAEARAVEAHVMACERCSLLLADAEHIRGLLVAADPGPMPADVWARIESALTSAVSESVSGAEADVSPPPVPIHVEHRLDSAGWNDDDPFDPSRQRATGGGRRRNGLVSVGSRREARPAGHRPGRWITAVAGLAAAVVAGVVAVNALHGQSSASSGTAAIAAGSDASSEASALAGGAAAGAGGGGSLASVRYEHSGTNYTQAGLARQAQALTRATTPATPVPLATGPGVTPPSREAAGVPAAPNGFVQGEPDPNATDIANPANLDGCLAALKTSRDRLVAVDLATYQDREAAVLVLRATGGGYEVFVVERTCSAGDDHTLAYTRLAS